MNFKKSIFCILFVFFAWSVYGCTSRTASTQSCSHTAVVQTASSDNSLLWRISGNGLASPSYLFGTHHLTPLSILDRVPGLNQAFEATEQVVGELDLRDMQIIQMQMMQHAMMPEGISYESLLSAEDITLLDSKLKSLLGVGIEHLGMLNPAMLTQTITLTLYQRDFPTTASVSLDEHFQQKAIARARPIKALDTPEFQIYALFGVSSIERQAEILMCLVRHPERGTELLKRLHELYYAFDINGLYAMVIEENKNSPCPSTDEEINALTRNRPLRNIDQLSAIINEKPSFIAVGALHLPGEYGLIEGLRRAGFTVEPVN